MSLTRFILAAALAASVPTVADATIVQTFSSRAAFTAGTLGTTSIPFSFGNTGDISPSFGIGVVTLTAGSGGVFGVDDFVSTEFDSDTLTLSFSSPIKAIGLLGGVADASLLYANGSLLVNAIGSGTTTLAANGGTASYIGLLSDVGFSQLSLQISSYDVNATSAPFVTLEQQVDVAGSGAVPEPAVWVQMLAGFLILGTALRRRRRSASTPALS